MPEKATHVQPLLAHEEDPRAAASAVINAAVRRYWYDPVFRRHIEHVVSLVTLDGRDAITTFDVRRGAIVATHLAWDDGS